MRSLLILLVLTFGCSTAAKAQTEIKVNPVLLLFGGLFVSVEQPITEQFGVEGTVWAAPDLGVAGFGLAKYYFKPRLGADNFYAGAFLGAGSFDLDGLNLGLGFHLGYKLVAKKGLLMDLNLGIGRALSSGGDPIPHFKIDFGYRLKQKNLYDRE